MTYPHNEVVPYEQPPQLITSAQPSMPPAVPVHGILLNGVLHVPTAGGWAPVGQQAKPAWVRNPRVFVPAGLVAALIGTAIVIIMGAALYAVVVIAMAHAVAIGVCLIGAFVLGLMAISSMTKLRHGYPGNPHDQHHRY